MTTEEKVDLVMSRKFTVKQFAARRRGSWPTESALRAIISDAAWGRNNFQAAFYRIGRRVLVDEEAFWRCVAHAQETKYVASKR